MAATDERTAARATGRYLHVSPYKVRQVLELVRGLPVDDAQRLLQLCEKDAADDVLKLLNSAIANGEHNLALEAEEMFVARAWADEGPTRKWGQPRARGRYFRVRKRTSHVTILLERFDTEELEERRRRDESTGRGAAVAQRRRAERVRRSRATEAEADEEPPAWTQPEVEEASIAEEELEAAEGRGVDVDDAIAEEEIEEEELADDDRELAVEAATSEDAEESEEEE